MKIIQIILGTIYTLFLPGFFMSFVFFSTKELKYLPRVALSIALSVISVSGVVFSFNLLGFKINSVNVFWETLLIIVVSLLFILIIKKIKK